MLIRVSGSLNDGRPFTMRVDAPDLFEAVARSAETLGNAGVVPSQIRAKALEGKSAVTIGKPREKKAKKSAAPATPAKK